MAVGERSGVEYHVGAASAVADGAGILVTAGDVEVGVFRVKGELRAYVNRCCHQGGPVCTGEIIGRYEQVLRPDRTVVEERFNDDEVHIACPWHGWEYNLETGQCIADRRFSLQSVELQVRDGEIYLVL